MPISAAPLRGDVLHDAVDPDGREQQREGAERAHQRRHHPLAGDRLVEDVAQPLRPRHGDAGIDVVHRGANRRQQREWIALGAAHVQSHADFVVLRQRHVEERRRVALDRADVDRIGHHADHGGGVFAVADGFPSGSRPGHNRAARDSLTIATGADAAAIVGREVATAHDRNAERTQVAVADDVHADVETVGGILAKCAVHRD